MTESGWNHGLKRSSLLCIGMGVFLMGSIRSFVRNFNKGDDFMAEMIQITFPDGNQKEFEKGSTTEDIASSISSGLKKQALAGKFNGQMVDLRQPLEDNGEIQIITYKDPEGLEVLRHSTAHLMAQAIRRLYGQDVKFGVGPVIEDGFYYDMDMEESITPEDLPKIEKEMKKITDEALEVHRIEVSPRRSKRAFQE